MEALQAYSWPPGVERERERSAFRVWKSVEGLEFRFHV